MTSNDRTGLTLEAHGATLVVRIDGGEHALLSPELAAELGQLVDKVDKDPDVHAVVFTGAHPDRFLSHADVTWLQEGGVGFPPINTRLARIVARMARGINRVPGVRSLAAKTRLKTLLQLDALHATLLKMNSSGTIFIAALNGTALAIGAPSITASCRPSKMTCFESATTKPVIIRMHSCIANVSSFQNPPA